MFADWPEFPQEWSFWSVALLLIAAGALLAVIGGWLAERFTRDIWEMFK
jgi:hypothetical protein